MDDIFTRLEKIFTPESYSKKLFNGSETHIIIVLNDDINSMNYIVEKLVDILNLSQTKARELMLRIHNEGIAVVWTGNDIEAEEYLSNLKEAGINSLMTSVS